MDPVLLDVLKQAPTTGVLLAALYYFLNHLKGLAADRAKDDEAREKREEERDHRHVALEEKRHEALKTLGDNCHAFQRELAGKYSDIARDMTVALRENAIAMKENAIALRENVVALRESGRVTERSLAIIDRHERAQQTARHSPHTSPTPDAV